MSLTKLITTCAVLYLVALPSASALSRNKLKQQLEAKLQVARDDLTLSQLYQSDHGQAPNRVFSKYGGYSSKTHGYYDGYGNYYNSSASNSYEHGRDRWGDAYGKRDEYTHYDAYDHNSRGSNITYKTSFDNYHYDSTGSSYEYGNYGSYCHGKNTSSCSGNYGSQNYDAVDTVNPDPVETDYTDPEEEVTPDPDPQESTPDPEETVNPEQYDSALTGKAYDFHGYGIGHMSVHFESPLSSSYLNNANQHYELKSGARMPDKKYFVDAKYDADTRTFTGSIDFSDDPWNSLYYFRYTLVFTQDFTTVGPGSKHEYLNADQSVFYTDQLGPDGDVTFTLVE